MMTRARVFALLFLVALVGSQELPPHKFVMGDIADDVGIVGDDDGSLNLPDVPDVPNSPDAADASEGNGTMLAGASGGGCGFGLPTSCAGDDLQYISVGVWLCSYDDPANCDCGDDGCANADMGFEAWTMAVGEYGAICDTLNGWDQRWVGSINFLVHPADLWKVDPNDVKLNLFQGDYCTGAPSQVLLSDGQTHEPFRPGQYSIGDTLLIKSIRPFVDQYHDGEEGIGIKFVGWPNGQMGSPYDEITCGFGPDDIWVNNVFDGCASAVDRIWCISPDADGSSDRIGENADFAGNQDTPRGWVDAYGGVPMGSMMFEVYDGYDGANCGYNWFNFCVDGSPENYCLGARFFNADAIDYLDSVNWDWDSSKDVELGEVWINMAYLCDNYGQNHFCLNTYDGSGDANNACQDGWITGPDDQPIENWPLFVDHVWTKIVSNPGWC